MRRRARFFSTLRMAACLLAMAFTATGAVAEKDFTPGRCYGSPFLKSECTQANFEGAIPHPGRDRELQLKLERQPRPNILIIYVDDMGWGDPGVYGGGPALGAPTPHIDALAARGLRMTSAYSQPACTPTRAAWQTGRLPQRTGLTRPTAAGEESGGMGNEVTIAELLRDAGYKTGMAGKWHLGEGPGMWPTDVGYDEYYGNLSVNTAYHDWRDKHFSPELVFDDERVQAMNDLDFVRTTVHSKAADIPSGKYAIDIYNPDDEHEIDLDCDNDGFCEQILEQEYLKWSKGFMKSAVQPATGDPQPFFLYHAMNKVHTKNNPHPDFEGKSPASTPYRDGMIEIDYVVGQLVEEIEKLDQTDNTFIFFTSDNGAEEDVHAGGINTSDSGHHPWRGGKGTTWEGGVRVSALAVWPGMIKAGRVSDGFFDHMDLFNTLARLGRADLSVIPETTYIDGIDQTSWLLTERYDEQESNREVVYYWYGQEFYGVRWAEFKRMERIMNVGMSVGPQTYGGLFNATKSETSDPSLGWYFNLYSDPKERMPITRTWNIGTLNELSTHAKMTFVNYPQAPNGVVLNGYILGGKAGGTVPGGSLKKLAEQLQAAMITHSNMPD